MKDYSVSGDFGLVKIYQTCVPSMRFHSMDRILCMGWHRVNQLYSIARPGGTDTDLLLLTKSGNGCIAIEETEYIATAGTVFLIPRNQKHSYAAMQGEPWEFYFIHYSGSHAQACTRDILQSGANGFAMATKEMDGYIGSLEHKHWQGAEGEIMESTTLCNILFALLKQSAVTQYNHGENAIISEMIQFMETNPERDFSLSNLANQYHYSRESIIRLFKSATGMTPYNYWRRFRLKQSCNALLQSNHTISQIAAQAGYACVGSFTNQFKRLFGMSPTEYRSAYKFH